MNTKKFNTLPLQKNNINNLNSLGFTTMTNIQSLALPAILDKKDIIAKAKTGSGKTVTFGLGVINNLNSSKYRIQALILCPTRELASQIAEVLRQLVRYIPNIKTLTLTGGVPYKPQVHSLYHQAHILVGTPGRVLKHLQENNFSTKEINTFVLDEADKMVDMGFFEDIEAIIKFLPTKRHNMLFSATFSSTLEDLSKKLLNDPIVIEAEQIHDKKSIEQLFYYLNPKEKQDFILPLLDKNVSSVLIFCNTKLQCDQLADYLEDIHHVEALVLHSDYDQTYRDETIILFENKSYPILIATDVASRGLDIDNIDLVINYDMPEDLENYVHRIGRTARSTNKGKAISFIDDLDYFEELKNYLDQSFDLEKSDILNESTPYIIPYRYSTLYINGGKKDKLRAGDILGALIQSVSLQKEDIGKISILPKCSYVAIKNDLFEKAFQGLQNNKIKNRYFKIYKR
jgi:ATP-dependent RNA helicase DbpA